VALRNARKQAFTKAKSGNVFGQRRKWPKMFRAGCSHLQHLYEPVLEREPDKRNLRKPVLAMDLLIETDEAQQDVAHRAARLNRYDERKHRRLAMAGFNF
jgi:NrtR DNA-binding winged helix domain